LDLEVIVMSQTSHLDPPVIRPPAPNRIAHRAFNPRDLLLGGAAAGSWAADLGLLLLRVIAGLALAFAHGLGKVPPSDSFVGWVGSMGMPAPGVLAWLSATAEFGGGLLLAFGLLTRPAALLVCGNMLIVTLVAHAGDPFGDREKAVLFGAIALLYLLAGAGRYSLDALIRRKRG
jgi:putative oxidoreductase